MSAVDPARVHFLTTDDRPANSRQYVLYWMQQSQRAVHNPALEYTIA